MYNQRIKRLIFTVVALVLLLACSSTATAQPTFTNTLIIPTVTATPSVLTCEQVEAVRREIRSRLTNAQQDLPNNELDAYVESIKGKEFQFSGIVDDVIIVGSDVNVFVEIPSCNRIHLAGIPEEVAVTLNKEQPVSGTGTISEEFQEGLIIHIDVSEFNYQ